MSTALNIFHNSKIKKSYAMLLTCFIITSCNQSSVGKTNIKNETSDNIKYNINDIYLRDDEIKLLIHNKIILTENDIIHNGGTLFYPNGDGVIFSEGTIKMKYSVDRDNICIVSRHSYCFKIKEKNGQYYKVIFNNNKIYEQKLEIRSFNI